MQIIMTPPPPNSITKLLRSLRTLEESERKPNRDRILREIQRIEHPWCSDAVKAAIVAQPLTKGSIVARVKSAACLESIPASNLPDIIQPTPARKLNDAELSKLIFRFGHDTLSLHTLNDDELFARYVTALSSKWNEQNEYRKQHDPLKSLIRPPKPQEWLDRAKWTVEELQALLLNMDPTDFKRKRHLIEAAYPYSEISREARRLTDLLAVAAQSDLTFPATLSTIKGWLAEQRMKLPYRMRKEIARRAGLKRPSSKASIDRLRSIVIEFASSKADEQFLYTSKKLIKAVRDAIPHLPVSTITGEQIWGHEGMRPFKFHSRPKNSAAEKFDQMYAELVDLIKARIDKP